MIARNGKPAARLVQVASASALASVRGRGAAAFASPTTLTTCPMRSPMNSARGEAVARRARPRRAGSLTTTESESKSHTTPNRRHRSGVDQRCRGVGDGSQAVAGKARCARRPGPDIGRGGGSASPDHTPARSPRRKAAWHHQDPFDRLLLAQALTDDGAIVSHDDALSE